MQNLGNRFEGRTVVVTGAASGFGEAMAKRFAAEGATVLAADVNADALDRVVAEIGEAGGQAVPRRVDVSRPEDIEAGAKIYNFGTQEAFGEESAGISIFAREGDRVFLTYQTFARGLDMLNGAYHMLDLTPKGRDEDQLPFTMAWLHRHDAYPG